MNPAKSNIFIFLAGVHGVGKSTLCRKVFEPAGFLCVSASSIIKNAQGEVSATKAVDDVRSNQRKLLDGLNMLRHVHQRVVIDGHFVLTRTDGHFECIEPQVYEKMRPDRIVVVRADPHLVTSRIYARDGTVWTSTFVSEFQDLEIAHAQNIATELDIPLSIIATPEEANAFLATL